MLKSSHLSAAEFELNSESLEIDDNKHDNHGSNQVAKIWSVLSVESLLKPIKLVRFGEHEVEKSNDGSLKFSSLVSSNGSGGERFPKDHFTNVGCNEE